MAVIASQTFPAWSCGIQSYRKHNQEGMMEKSNQEEILRNYSRRVALLQNEYQRALVIDDLKEIARDLGMSDDDMAAADKAVEAYIERGLLHGAHRRWGDTIAELSEAVALNPTDLRALYGLAVAYKERWLATGSSDDRVRAERLARQLLQLYPDYDPAHVLLNELEPAKQLLPAGRRGKPIPPQRWLFVIPILFGLAVLGWLFLWPDLTFEEPMRLALQEDPATMEHMAATASPQAASDADIGLLGQGIPVVWECPQGEGMKVELREMYNRVGTSRKLQFLIDNTGDVPLHGMEIRIDDYDTYGLLIASKRLRLLADKDAPIAEGMVRTTYLEYPVTGYPASYKVAIVAAR